MEMKRIVRHFSLAGKGRLHTVEQFCQDREIEYVGKIVRNADGRYIGELAILHDLPYLVEITSVIKQEKGMKTIAKFEFLHDYSIESYKKFEDCAIVVDIWDYSYDSIHPVAKYAFPYEEQRKAIGIIESHTDIEIWLDGKKVSKKKMLKPANPLFSS